MAAPATAERTRAATGAIPATLKAAAPDELRVEGVEEAAPDVPVVATDGTDETGVVAVAAGVEAVPGEVAPVPVVAGVDAVDAAVPEILLAAPMEKVPLSE